MSVELRWTTEGECTCGRVFSIADPPPPHGHDLCCEWGVIEFSCPRPDRGEVGHLMLAIRKHIAHLIDAGPVLFHSNSLHSVTHDGDRLFAHIDYQGQRWTWELFDAHMADGLGPDGLLIGRWPD